MKSMILQFIIFGVLPLSFLTGYLLTLSGYSISATLWIVIPEFIFGIIFVNFLAKLSEGQINKQMLLWFLIIAMVSAIILVVTKKHAKDEEYTKDEQTQEQISQTKDELRAEFSKEILDVKSQIETPKKNAYSEGIPKPQNAEEAFKQHTEADYEFRNENYIAARKIYKNLLENYSASDQLRSILQNSIGATYGNEDDLDSALAWYNKAKEYEKHSLNVHENIARNYFKRGEYDKAIDEYNEILKKNPTDYSVYNKLGLMYSLKGQYDEAINNFNKALENGFIIKTLYFNLALNYAHKGPEFDNKVIEYLEKELGLYPDNPIAMFQLGAAYGWQRNFEKGIPLIERAIVLNNQLVYDLPKFGLPGVDGLQSLDEVSIDAIHIFPDKVIVETSEKQ